MTTFRLTHKKPLKNDIEKDIKFYKDFIKSGEIEMMYLKKQINGTPNELDYDVENGIQHIYVRKGRREDLARYKELNEEIIIAKKVVMTLESILNYDVMLK